MRLSPTVLRSIGAGLCTLAGGLFGAVIADKRLEAKYVEIAETEIDQAREYYRNTFQPEDPEALASRLYGIEIQEVLAQELTDSDRVEIQARISAYFKEKDAVEVLAEEKIHEALEEAEDRVKTIFDRAVDAGENVGKPVRSEREVKEPYVISSGEYFENQPDYHQVDVVYYEGDEVLTDAQDKPLSDDLVGTANLELFGTRSKDPNIVYIRNEAMKTDFCVTRDGRSYEDHVAGFQHSTGLRRMRGDD